MTPDRLIRAAAVLLCVAAPVSAQPRLAPPARDSGLIAWDDEGLRIHSPDGRRQLRLRGYFAAEGRMLLRDTADAPANGFVIRRSRLLIDANLNPWLAMRLLFDIAQPAGAHPLTDAYVDVGLPRGWWVRAGRMKTPVGLERYTTISAQLLPERSIASNLNASRDAGILATGSWREGGIEVSLGAFNGAPDGGATQEVDANDGKDFVYRVWLRPLRRHTGGVEQGVGVALNGSYGMSKATGTSALLPTFRTPAQLPFFSYNEVAGVRAAGRHSRSVFFGYAFLGRVGGTAEWMTTSQQVTRGIVNANVPSHGLLANAQVVLTGEPAALEGLVPRAPFDPGKGQWGAVQVGARFAQVNVGREAFPVFADSSVAARRASEVGVALNWYITRSTKVQVAYEQTAFGGGVRNGDRPTERYMQLRWQAYF